MRVIKEVYFIPENNPPIQVPPESKLWVTANGLYFFISGIMLLGVFLSLLTLKDSYLAISILIIFVGNYGIGIVTQNLHTELGNREHDKQKPQGLKVRAAAALLEIICYTIFLSLNQILLTTGYLVIKSVGSHWGAKENPSEEGNAVGVYRIGILSQLIISSIAAYFLIHSNHFNQIKTALNFLIEKQT